MSKRNFAVIGFAIIFSSCHSIGILTSSSSPGRTDEIRHCAPALMTAREPWHFRAMPELNRYVTLAATSVIDVGEEDMVFIPGGDFDMGSENSDDSRPVHSVRVDGFWIDEHEVTNAQFAKFVKATGYITVAERDLNPKDYPGADPALLVPGSAVFIPPAQAVSLDNPMQWWQYVAAATWKSPKGPGSSIDGKQTDPVVQVCYEDALAYANWAGKRLPTEAE